MLFLSCFLEFAWLPWIMLCDLFLLLLVLSFLLRNMGGKGTLSCTFLLLDLFMSLSVDTEKEERQSNRDS